MDNTIREIVAASRLPISIVIVGTRIPRWELSASQDDELTRSGRRGERGLHEHEHPGRRRARTLVRRCAVGARHRAVRPLPQLQGQPPFAPRRRDARRDPGSGDEDPLCVVRLCVA
jgi:hypothetical protein